MMVWYFEKVLARLGADSALLVGQEFLEHVRDCFGGLGRFHDRPSGVCW
jgi:hypothetical protein